MNVQRLHVDVPSSTEGEHRTNTFRYLLDHVIHPSGRRLLDLGAGTCSFAKIARDRGFDVVAVDGRSVRVPDAAELGSIRFIQSDVREFDIRGFDIILIFGLLYHLDIPDQIDLLNRCNYAPVVIVDTQVHDAKLATVEMAKRSATGIIERDGYTGVEFIELNNPMAAIGNPRSFWHTEGSILKLFGDCGYKSAILIDPVYVSKHGMRRFFILPANPGFLSLVERL